jgi:hypothetical protein
MMSLDIIQSEREQRTEIIEIYNSILVEIQYKDPLLNIRVRNPSAVSSA